jgi:hypothetical protein
MAYKPKIGDCVRVYVKVKYHEHFAGLMTITDVHYNSNQLHYVNTVSADGNCWEIEASLFEIKLVEKGN